MKKLIIFLLIIFSLSVNAESKVVTLDSCVDGDTAWFIYNGNREKFRFLAIDTPETVHPTKVVESYGKDASEYTCNLLTNAKEILVEFDNGSDKLDKYNRYLAWIWVDGELLQEKLISVGYAKVAYIYGDYMYTKSLCKFQNQAYIKKLGLWMNEEKQGYCDTVDYEHASDIKIPLEKSENLNIFNHFFTKYPVIGVIVVLAAIVLKKKKK